LGISPMASLKDEKWLLHSYSSFRFAKKSLSATWLLQQKNSKQWGEHRVLRGRAPQRVEAPRQASCASGGSLPSRLAQAEVALRFVQRDVDFAAAVVGRHGFGNLLPVRRTKAWREFENEIGERQRPRNGDVVVTARNR